MLAVVSLIAVFTQPLRSLCTAVSFIVCTLAFLYGPHPCQTHTFTGGNKLNDRHLMWVASKQDVCVFFVKDSRPLLKTPFVLHSLLHEMFAFHCPLVNYFGKHLTFLLCKLYAA